MFTANRVSVFKYNMTTSSVTSVLHHSTFIFMCFSHLSVGKWVALYPLELNTAVISKKFRHFAEVLKALLLIAPLRKRSSVKKKKIMFSHFTKFKLGETRESCYHMQSVTCYHLPSGFRQHNKWVCSNRCSLRELAEIDLQMNILFVLVVCECYIYLMIFPFISLSIIYIIIRYSILVSSQHPRFVKRIGELNNIL